MRLRLSWRSSMFDEKLTQSLIYKPISSSSPSSSPPSNPPTYLTDLWSFTSLFLSIYLSLSLSHDQCLFLRKTEFFLLCFFVDLVYIFRFPIIIFRATHLKSFSFLKNIFTWKYFTLWNHFTLSQIWVSVLVLCSSVSLF